MRGIWQEKPIAIKEFTKEVIKEDVLKELSIMSLVQHPNLVKCYGGITRDNRMIIVQELMQCNLADVLAETSIKLDTGNVLFIALQAANGIHFLHHHCNMIHRDLKSPNILVTATDSIEAKVTDFGASRVLNRRSAMTGNVGTVAWIAPEVFGQKKYNEKCDVYSFGIILWELLSRKIPFSHMNSFAIPMGVIKGERPPLKKEYNPGLVKLIKECWADKPTKRPAFSQIIATLKKIHANLRPSEKIQTTLDLQKLFPMPSSKEDDPTGPSHSPYQFEMDSNDWEASTSDSQSSKSVDQILLTCSIPPQWSKPLYKLESKVNQEMATMRHDLDQGKISTNHERFILIRANSLVSDFGETTSSSIECSHAESSSQFSQNLVYDLGFAVGRQTALSFFSKDESLTTKSTRVTIGFVHIAYSGLSFVTLLPDSDFENDVYITEHSISFEADLLAQNNKDHQHHTGCHMTSGYISGWCTEAVGSVMVTAEVSCRAKGDARCLLITCEANRIQQNFQQYCQKNKIANSKLPSFLELRVTKSSTPRKMITKSESWVDINQFKLKLDAPATPGEKQTDNSGVFEGTPLKPQEIDVRVDSCLENFYLDPSSATIELAHQRCLMLQENILSRGFFALVGDLFEDEPKSTQFSWGSSFLYSLAKSIGESSCENFCGQLGLGTNGISKALALSANLAYNGWSSFRILKGLDQAELKKDNFLVVCGAMNTFEASAWSKPTVPTSFPLLPRSTTETPPREREPRERENRDSIKRTESIKRSTDKNIERPPTPPFRDSDERQAREKTSDDKLKAKGRHGSKSRSRERQATRALSGDLTEDVMKSIAQATSLRAREPEDHFKIYDDGKRPRSTEKIKKEKLESKNSRKIDSSALKALPSSQGTEDAAKKKKIFGGKSGGDDGDSPKKHTDETPPRKRPSVAEGDTNIDRLRIRKMEEVLNTRDSPNRPRLSPQTTQGEEDVDVPPCVCFMHCGYISGWFESAFKKKCSVVEVRCVSKGARRCEFYVAHPDYIKKFSSNFTYLDASNIQGGSQTIMHKLGQTRDRLKDSV